MLMNRGQCLIFKSDRKKIVGFTPKLTYFKVETYFIEFSSDKFFLFIWA